jgi:glycosyltransferase involved in cell wall biosynthesis
MASSVHTARWIDQFADTGWDLHLFPATGFKPHALLRNVTFHGFRGPGRSGLDASVTQQGPLWPLPRGKGAGRAMSLIPPLRRERRVARLIRRLEPDIVHSMEIQHAGYVTLAARERIPEGFPPWVVSNWGSDTYYYAHLPEHNAQTRRVLSTCDYLFVECLRDLPLTTHLGFRGEALPVLPSGGGFDIDAVKSAGGSGLTSSRRIVMVKGYQDELGRALVALDALERCADLLDGYRVVVYLAPEAVKNRVAELSESLPIEVMPQTTHDEMLRLHSRARVSIGLSLSDGLSQSFLEAVIAGAFPIQSRTACADEWVEHGVSGLIVEPDDVNQVADALRLALTDDSLVDRAAAINDDRVRRDLGRQEVAQTAISAYERVVAPPETIR